MSNRIPRRRRRHMDPHHRERIAAAKARVERAERALCRALDTADRNQKYLDISAFERQLDLARAELQDALADAK